MTAYLYGGSGSVVRSISAPDLTWTFEVIMTALVRYASASGQITLATISHVLQPTAAAGTSTQSSALTVPGAIGFSDLDVLSSDVRHYARFTGTGLPAAGHLVDLSVFQMSFSEAPTLLA